MLISDLFSMKNKQLAKTLLSKRVKKKKSYLKTVASLQIINFFSSCCC